MAEVIPELEQLATIMVGDGCRPNLFFVSDQGIIILATTDAERAYAAWACLADCWERRESALEDRLCGVLCDVSPDEDNGGRLVVRNDFEYWRRTHGKETATDESV